MTRDRDRLPISPLANQTLKPGVKWLPLQREQATGVAARSGLEDRAQKALIKSSAEILGSGMDPRVPGRATGLVVGYVQSGKTLSFTTVIGLARDNGFPLVIVVAGNKDNLLSQSHERLRRDLDVDGGDGLPPWIMEKNPSVRDGEEEQLLQRTIENWRDASLETDEKPTLLLTVLKQKHRLTSLTALLGRMNLTDVPVLVIDDEADQASLNTKVNDNDESPTYTRIRLLRDALPNHTLLQYTATPQAPLLINIADVLSPDFVHVLQPGTGYVGGEAFFAPGSQYAITIPAADVPPAFQIGDDPPESLVEALRVYFVGLAVSIIQKGRRKSMLIHPAVHRLVHQAYAQWAAAAKDAWAGALRTGDGDPDRADTVRDFHAAYRELERTSDDLPSFDLVLEKLPRALRNTTVIEFNTRGRPKTPEINWRHAEGWILVGGQAVDRGFTVDSLSVTYMPRSPGVGNADTVQQRARFFGYKQAYLGLCRVYLESQTRQAFERYVEHEQTMRRELQHLEQTGESLKAWRRRFVLDPSLQPCRRSVISDRLIRARTGSGWTEQKGALLTPGLRNDNREAVQKFIAGIRLQPETSYVSNEVAQQHLSTLDVPLSEMLGFLVEYGFDDPRDTANFTAFLISASEAWRNDPNLTGRVYVMRPRASVSRTINADGTIENFLQGRTDRAGGYPGDTFFSAPDKVTLQIHTYDLKVAGRTVAPSAPLLAINVPRSLARNWLFQTQRGQN